MAQTRKFRTIPGFTFNNAFNDAKSVDKVLCLVLNEDEIHAMLITHQLYSTFTNRPIADNSNTQELLAIEVAHRE